MRAQNGAAFRCRWDRPSARPGPARGRRRQPIAASDRRAGSASVTGWPAGSRATRQRRSERQDEGPSAASRLRGVGARASLSRSRPDVGRVGAGAGLLAGDLRSAVGGALQRGDVFRVGRRFCSGRSVRQRASHGVAARGSARACGPAPPARMSSVMTCATSGILRSAHRRRRRLGERRHQHVDRVGAGVRIVAQIQEGRDRFDVRASQIASD